MIKLYYQEYHRYSNIEEYSNQYELYDKSLFVSYTKEQELEEIHDNAQLYNLLNRWFRYVEDGDEGCDRAEGHGWYFKIYLRIDSEFIDITEHTLNYFETLKDRIQRGLVQ